jgi:hypothetical protein
MPVTIGVFVDLFHVLARVVAAQVENESNV